MWETSEFVTFWQLIKSERKTCKSEIQQFYMLNVFCEF